MTKSRKISDIYQDSEDYDMMIGVEDSETLIYTLYSCQRNPGRDNKVDLKTSSEERKMKKKCISKIVVCMILTLLAVQSFKVGARAEEADKDNTGEVVNYNGHAYAIFEEGISWDDAKEACENVAGI